MGDVAPGGSHLPGLVLGLARFCNASLKAAAAKVLTQATAEGLTQADKDAEDGRLLASLLCEPPTRERALLLLRETMSGNLGFGFKENGNVLGFFQREESRQFARMCTRHGVHAALMRVLEEAVSGAVPLPHARLLDALFCLVTLMVILEPTSSADQDAAADGLPGCSIAGLAAALAAGLKDRSSPLWRSHTTLVLALRISGLLSGFVSVAMLAGRHAAPASASAGLSLTADGNVAGTAFGPHLSVLSSLNASAAVHDSITYLLRSSDKEVMSPLGNVISGFVSRPGFLSGPHALRTAPLLLQAAIETTASSAAFPVLRDPSMLLVEPYRTARTDEYRSWAANYFVSSAVVAAVSLLDGQREAARSLLLAGGVLPTLVLQLVSAPLGRGLLGPGIALAVFCGQDPQVRAALTANGALAAAFAGLRRYQLSYEGAWSWLQYCLPRLLAWARDGLTDPAQDPTGLAQPFAVATLGSVAASSSTLAQLRPLVGLYRSFESALLDVASLTTDPVQYQVACSALSYLDTAPPPFGKARHRASQQVRGGGRLARSPLVWTVEDVAAWASRQSFHTLTPALRVGCVDGATLLTLGDEDLAEAGLTSSVQRAVALDAIDTLHDAYGVHVRAPVGGACEEQAVSPVGTLVSPTRASSSGVAALFPTPTARSSGGLSLDSPEGSAGPVKPKFDVFISYRRTTGSHLARLVVVYLKLAGFSPFIDVEGLAEGAFDTALENMLVSVQHVVVLLTEGALDRCMADTEGKDFVRKEIATALRLKKNVVPVANNFTFPKPEDLPLDIRGLLSQNTVEWSHTYVDACVGKIVRFLRGEKE